MFFSSVIPVKELVLHFCSKSCVRQGEMSNTSFLLQFTRFFFIKRGGTESKTE